MSKPLRTPMVVIVRDGWGCNPNPAHHDFNAVELASTPRCDDLRQRYPWVLIHTSGENVGLPEGTMGNSEVGHQNIGAGRIVDQDSVRITRAIRTGEFFDNAALRQAVTHARQHNATVHLMGLASDVGVHSRLGHLYGCLELCKRMDHDKVAIHCFTDGRDSGPFTGKGYIAEIEQNCREIGVGRVASICGRYYAMDRDNRWERVQRAYELLTSPAATAEAASAAVPHYPTSAAAMQHYYNNPTNDSQQGDEFVTPRTVGDDPASTRIADGDAIIFFNFRGDRPRELTRAFVLDDQAWADVKPSPDSGNRGFERGDKLNVHYVTLTAYEQQLNDLVSGVAYPKPPRMTDIGGQWIAEHDLAQFRCAETEKFPHVTFFFNDYRDDPFAGEDRVMPQSPKVPTYDLEPQMSAAEVRDAVLDALDRDYAFILVNFANGDMVGHTGKLDAAIKAVEAVDQCVGTIVDKALQQDGQVIVTADHGNAEQMWDPQNDCPHTAHTTYDVEMIVADPRYEQDAGVKLLEDGRLADIIPTAFALMGLSQPDAMTGRSLLRD